MVLDNIKITYDELVKQIDKRAGLLAHRFKEGEKVIIKNINPINTIINFLACCRAGLISIPVDSKMLSLTLEEIKKNIKPCCTIDDEFFHIKYNNSEENSQEHKYCLKEESMNCNVKLPVISHKDIFFGALSSGTTGPNRVIWRNHKSWTSTFKYQSEVFHINSQEILFLVGALSYTANLNSAMHMLNEGGTIVFSKSIYPKTWLKEIEKNNVTSIFMVPAYYRLIIKEIKENILKVKSVLSAGDKLDIETVNVLKERFPKAHICEYYGASELGHVTYINFRENFKVESVGKAFPGVQLWIEDDLIWVKSQYIAPDFAPKATVLDLGKIDEEGNLYLLGRKKDIINKGGVKILPYNIEKVLNKHPEILKSVVFGVQHVVKGEEIGAVIFPKSNKLSVRDIMKYCKNNLELHCRPQKIKIVNHMELNLSGKVDKRKFLELMK